MPHPIAVLLVDEQHQQDGDFNFDAEHEQEFDLNLEAADHRNELQQMISKGQCNLDFFSYYFSEHIDSLKKLDQGERRPPDFHLKKLVL
jgi:hypothetical protein